jgi:amino acid permease
LTEETGSLDVWQFTRALSAFTFAFAGNTIYLEMMAEMKEPRDFAKSLNLALPCLLVVYMIVGLGAYAKCGDNTPSYLLDALEEGNIIKRIVSFLLFVHVVTSYIINQQVLCRGVHLFLAPSKAVVKDRRQTGFYAATLQWFVITTGAMAVALALALSIPTFEDIVSLIGAALATPLCFVFPAVCFLGTARMQGLTPHRFELSWNVVLFLAFVAATVLGTIAAIKKMLYDINSSN